MLNENFLHITDNVSFLSKRKLNIKKFVQADKNVTIIPENIDLNFFEEIQVIIKNIKTKEEYLCPFTKNNNSIIIDLSGISHLFTDYEGAIYIILKKDNIIYNLKPIIKNSTIIKNNLNNDNKRYYSWFVRILDNGEILFSSIIKKINK
jgi:hypothetical protein